MEGVGGRPRGPVSPGQGRPHQDGDRAPSRVQPEPGGRLERHAPHRRFEDPQQSLCGGRPPWSRRDGSSTAPWSTHGTARLASGRRLGNSCSSARTKGFREVRVYSHMDRPQRAIQALEFTNVHNRQIEASVDSSKDDNSDDSARSQRRCVSGWVAWTTPRTPPSSSTRYGHAIQDDQVPGQERSRDAGAMGGVRRRRRRQLLRGGQEPVPQASDRLAGRDGRQRRDLTCPPAARQRDEVSGDMVYEVHDDGAIWSACL